MSIPNAILDNAYSTLGLGAVFAGFFAVGSARIEKTVESTTFSRTSLIAGALFGIGAGILEAIMKVPNNVKTINIIGYSILVTMAVIALYHFQSSKPVCIGGLAATVMWASKFYYWRNPL